MQNIAPILWVYKKRREGGNAVIHTDDIAVDGHIVE